MSNSTFGSLFMRFSERFQLNPSNWVPHIRPEGVYELGTRYDSVEDIFDLEGNLGEGTQVPIESFSIWGVFWTICHTRRERSNRMVPSRWEEFWGFLFEVETGLYDTTDWVPMTDDVESDGDL